MTVSSRISFCRNGSHCPLPGDQVRFGSVVQQNTQDTQHFYIIYNIFTSGAIYAKKHSPTHNTNDSDQASKVIRPAKKTTSSLPFSLSSLQMCRSHAFKTFLWYVRAICFWSLIRSAMTCLNFVELKTKIVAKKKNGKVARGWGWFLKMFLFFF